MIHVNRQRLLMLSTVLTLFFSSSVLAQTKHPAEEAGIKSTSGSSATSTYIRFINKSQEQIKVYWLDDTGKRVLYLTLNPQEDGGIQTYLTHPWLVTDSQDNAKDIFFPDSRGRTVEIHSKKLSSEATINQIFRSDTPFPDLDVVTDKHQNLMEVKTKVVEWLGSYQNVSQENDRSVINFEQGSISVKVIFGEDGKAQSIIADQCPSTSMTIAQAPQEYRQALSACPDLKP
ncbi:MAG: hypothetical protein ACRC80_21565 [Waterburya sp.]